jgi:phage terminase small subunit
VTEYLKDQNGTQAAIRAGYSKKTAQEISSRLLSKAIVRTEVEKALEEIRIKSELTSESVLRRLNEVANRCIQSVEPKVRANGLFKLDRLTGKICFDFDASGANRALELLGKSMGMFVDKHDVTVGGRMIIVRAKGK